MGSPSTHPQYGPILSTILDPDLEPVNQPDVLKYILILLDNREHF